MPRPELATVAEPVGHQRVDHRRAGVGAEADGFRHGGEAMTGQRRNDDVEIGPSLDEGVRQPFELDEAARPAVQQHQRERRRRVRISVPIRSADSSEVEPVGTDLGDETG